MITMPSNLHTRISDKAKAASIWAVVIVAVLTLTLLVLVPSRFGPYGG